MKLKTITGLVACIMTLSAGCTPKPDMSGRENARLLYDASVKLIHVYLASIANTPDSAAVATINNNFVEAVAKLNFKYPANTDLHMTEMENEILAKMTARFAGLSAKRLKDLKGHPNGMQADSLRNDSLKNATTKEKSVKPSSRKPTAGQPASRSENSQTED